jgi:hypothetical protein
MILTYPPQYDIAIQARIPPALCAVHNFIRIHNSDEIDEFNLNIRDQDPGHVYGELAEGPALRAEKDRVEI